MELLGVNVKKILIAIIVFALLILLAAVLNIIPYFDFYAPDDTTEYTDLFDYSAKPIVDWNDSSKEFKWHQKVVSVDNNDFENVSIDLLFYNYGKLIGVQSSDIDETENGTFDLDFKIKLESHPDAIYYNVTNLDEC